MNDERLDDMLKTCFDTNFTMDDRLKAEVKRKMYEKQAKREKVFLCAVQIALFIMAALITIALFFIGNTSAATLVISYVFIGGFVSTIIILVNSKTKAKGEKTYEYHNY